MPPRLTHRGAHTGAFMKNNVVSLSNIYAGGNKIWIEPKIRHVTDANIAACLACFLCEPKTASTAYTSQKIDFSHRCHSSLASKKSGKSTTVYQLLAYSVPQLHS